MAIALPGGPHPRVLVTAGPTAEDIDPVRFITNRSTGRMGAAVALAVRRAGGTPLLVLGPTNLEPPPETAVVRVRSAADMLRAVMDRLEWADSLVMTAAVADYTPAEPLATKLKKGDGDLVLRLKRTADILAEVKKSPLRPGKFIVGFSLDVSMNLAEGRRKMRDKDLDLMVVNSAAAFGADRSSAWMLSPDGEKECGEMEKGRLADAVVSCILARFPLAASCGDAHGQR